MEMEVGCVVDTGSKTATTLLWPFITTLADGLEPEAFPSQRVNWYPGLALAVRETVVSAL